MFDWLANILKWLFWFLLFAIFYWLFGETFNDHLNNIIININSYVLVYIDTITLWLIILLIFAVLYRFFFWNLRR